MQWSTEAAAIPPADIPYFNLHYLYASPPPVDPTLIWGTEVEVDRLTAFLNEANAQSRVLLSPAHVLMQAVGRTLADFPQLNCRVIGRRIHRFRTVNVRTMIYNRRLGDVDVVIIKDADRVSLERLARRMWKRQTQAIKQDSLSHQIARRLPAFLLRWCVRTYFWLDRHFRLPETRLNHISGAPVLVNYLGFAGAPPMRMYKPSKHPDDSSHLSITMGKSEARPVVRDGRVVVRSVAPLFVRADHRITDAYVLAQFLNKLCARLTHPAQIDSPPQAHDQPTEPARAA